MKAIKTKRPRIVRVPVTPFQTVVRTMAEYYELTPYEVMRVYRSQGYDLGNTRMILNLKNRSHA